ncbi:MAG: hypothetical protein WCR97_06125 [Bacilli bacterium]
MKKIFVYYSWTGNGDAVAEILKTMGYEILKLTTNKPKGKSNFFKMMIYGQKALKGEKARLNQYNLNIDDYENIVIGSPIWAGKLSTPINTYLDENMEKLSNRKISFVLSAGGNDATKAQEFIKNIFKNSTSIVISMPKKHLDTLKETLNNFLK